MVQEEFKKNQLFYYPEEYDLFDKDLEANLKKNFTMDKKDQNDKTLGWKVPNFSNEQTILDNFKKKDMFDKKDLERHVKEMAKKEMALEAFLQKQAIDYQDYMANRHAG